MWLVGLVLVIGGVVGGAKMNSIYGGICLFGAAVGAVIFAYSIA